MSDLVLTEEKLLEIIDSRADAKIVEIEAKKEAARKEKAAKSKQVYANLSEKEKKEYDREFIKAWYNGDERTMKAMTTSTASSLMLPAEFEAGIVAQRNAYGVSRRLGKVENVNSQTHNVVVEGADVSLSIVAENTAYTTISDSNPTAVPFTIKKGVAIAYITNEAELFAREDPIGYLSFKFGKGIAKLEDNQYFAGDGTGSNFTGLIAATLVAGQKTVLATTAITSLTYAKLIDCLGNLPNEYSTSSNLKWAMNRAVFYKNVLGLVDDQHRPIVEYVSNLSGGAPTPILLGYPVEFSADLPSTQTASAATRYIYFGDFEVATRVIARSGLEIENSTNAVVGATNAFTQGGRFLKVNHYFSVGVADNRAICSIETAP